MKVQVYEGQIMKKAIRQFNNIRVMRAQARKLPLQALEEFLDRFTVVVVERRYEEANRQTVERQRQAKINKLRSMMLDEGFDPVDLLPSDGRTASQEKKK